MKTYTLKAITAGVLLAATTSTYAIPTLQVGAPAPGGTCTTGPYVQNTADSANPTEEDTAIISGGTICAAGLFGPNTVSLGTETNYSVVGGSAYSLLDGLQAVLMVSVSNLADAAGITVGGNAADVTTTTLTFPNNHAPLQDAEGYLFFDIGAFAENTDAVADFQELPLSFTGDGEIKSLSVSGFGSLAWAHFDLLAIEVTETGPNIRSTLQNNPGSHDVTWKNPGTVQDPQPNPVPEPGILSLLAAGLLGIGAKVKRKNA